MSGTLKWGRARTPPSPRTNRLIAEAVRAVRLSIAELSAELGITYVTLFNYRRGRRRRIPVRFVAKLSRVLRRQARRMLHLARLLSEVTADDGR
ncbi:MAG TPA: helix-turn-helix domain-containing protein [Gemmatimonadales bacterium]|nr:helix-turn-helix domain-containing protein [Gemmatimonadales bacterium]